MEDPLVSVIMPAYNRAACIKDSLESVKGQSYPHWECIIVDDGSTDHTQDVVQDVIGHDSRFKYFKQSNQGAAAARNCAVRNSQGVYILPLDSDDLIGAGYIEAAVLQFIKDPELTLVYSKAEKIGEETGAWPIPPFDYRLFLVYNMIFNSSLFKRADFDAVGGYSEDTMFEDWDLWIKLLKKGGRVCQLPEVYYYYRTHEEASVTSYLSNDSIAFKNSMDALFKHHVDTYLVHLGNPILLERERRELASEVASADYKAAITLVQWPVFRFLRSLRGRLKRFFI